MEITVLIADYPIVISGILAEAEKTEDIRVVGSSTTGQETLYLIHELDPDVLMMEIELPELEAWNILPKIRSITRKTKILVFTTSCNSVSLLALIRQGVNGIEKKDADVDKLLKAIRVVAVDGQWYCENVLEILSHQFEYISDSQDEVKLTKREFEVLTFLATGLSNDEIALKIGSSERCVRFHINNLKDKFGANNRLHLVVTAARMDIISIK